MINFITHFKLLKKINLNQLSDQAKPNFCVKKKKELNLT